MTTASIHMQRILDAANEGIAEFSGLVAGIPYEKKGILFSELFFLWALARDLRPARILESGRARGQSTLILSLCFPDAQIISVEFDRDSPDVEVAAMRLKDRPNVQQLFGDATKLLPSIAKPSDIAIIDGPKGYRGLRLALTMLGRRLPMVFLHDTCGGSEERRFLDRRMPEAVYSDQPEIAIRTHSLDQGMWEDLAPNRRWAADGAPTAGYGFSLACIPRTESANYKLLFLNAVADGLLHRLHRH